MRIRGLAANDPTVEQYQLWIFDAERNADHPIDGGVFDVAADGEVVVPMDPRLPVGRATLFAVTVEKPGGVVVSSRERLPLLAAVQ
jgi:anti-sigma-K factor RskA